MPALYIGHGAPPLVDDEPWVSQLAAWAQELPRPGSILMIAAHWESAPLSLSAADRGVPLVYDLGGFDEKHYEVQYDAPGPPQLARDVAALTPAIRPSRPGTSTG